MMQKVAIFLADGFEEIEALTVVDLCRRAGIDITMISISAQRSVVSSHKVVVEADKCLEEIDFKEYVMLVLPGGMPGTIHLEECQKLMDEIEWFYREGRYLAAICAAPRILGKKGMLSGKNACCFPEYECELAGANVLNVPACKDGKIITGRGMGCSVAFALLIVETLLGKESKDALSKKIIWL